MLFLPGSLTNNLPGCADGMFETINCERTIWDNVWAMKLDCCCVMRLLRVWVSVFFQVIFETANPQLSQANDVGNISRRVAETRSCVPGVGEGAGRGVEF